MKEDTATLLSMKEWLGKVTYENIVSMDWWGRVHEEAKERNLLVAFPVSDDLLYTAGYDNDEYGAWEGTTIYVTDTGVSDKAKPSSYGKLLLAISSIWLNNSYSHRAWELVTTSRNYTTFNIFEDNDLWANGLIIDMNKDNVDNE